MKKIIISSTVYLLPMMAFAQGVNTSLSRLSTSASLLGTLVDTLIPVVFGAALLAFFWGLVKYIWGEAEEKEKGRNIMIYGIIALFVMSSVWGIVRLLQTSVGIDDNPQGQNVPRIN